MIKQPILALLLGSASSMQLKEGFVIDYTDMITRFDRRGQPDPYQIPEPYQLAQARNQQRTLQSAEQMSNRDELARAEFEINTNAEPDKTKGVQLEKRIQERIKEASKLAQQQQMPSEPKPEAHALVSAYSQSIAADAVDPNVAAFVDPIIQLAINTRLSAAETGAIDVLNVQLDGDGVVRPDDASGQPNKDIDDMKTVWTEFNVDPLKSNQMKRTYKPPESTYEPYNPPSKEPLDEEEEAKRPQAEGFQKKVEETKEEAKETSAEAKHAMDEALKKIDDEKGEEKKMEKAEKEEAKKQQARAKKAEEKEAKAEEKLLGKEEMKRRQLKKKTINRRLGIEEKKEEVKEEKKEEKKEAAEPDEPSKAAVDEAKKEVERPPAEQPKAGSQMEQERHQLGVNVAVSKEDQEKFDLGALKLAQNPNPEIPGECKEEKEGEHHHDHEEDPRVKVKPHDCDYKKDDANPFAGCRLKCPPKQSFEPYQGVTPGSYEQPSSTLTQHPAAFYNKQAGLWMQGDEFMQQQYESKGPYYDAENGLWMLGL